MIRNYLAVAVRNLLRHGMYSAINVFGLAVGIACCVLIMLFVTDELSYDRHHEKGDRIYRMVTSGWASLPYALSERLFADHPQVEATRLYPRHDELLTVEDRGFFGTICFADANVLDVFTFPLIEGDKTTALEAPRSVVLTETLAQKLFPDGKALGKTVRSGRRDLVVTGVMHDLPSTTHMKISALVSGSTLAAWRQVPGRNYQTFHYLLFDPPYGPDDFLQNAEQMTRTFWPDRENPPILQLQALRDIHLHSTLEKEFAPNGDVAYVYIFSATAVFVLLIGCVNFMNLAMARSEGRAREVGLRKVVGARRTQLVAQFLGESLLLSAIALAVALVMVTLSLPWLNALSGKTLTLGAEAMDLVMNLVVLTLGVGLVSGSYPALFLSRFEPATAVKGSKQIGGGRMRRVLVTGQFVVSVVLLVATAIVSGQLDHIQTRRLGFDKEQVLVIRRGAVRREDYALLKPALKMLPDVVSVTMSTSVPGVRVMVEGIDVMDVGEQEGDDLTTRLIVAGYDFLETMGVALEAGRDFSEAFSTDVDEAYLLSERAVKELGWDAEGAIGKEIAWRKARGKVIGVFEDFHYASMHQLIEPVLIKLRQTAGSWISIRLKPNAPATALSAVEAVWAEHLPGVPFDYRYLNSQYEALHRAEQRTGRVIGAFSAIGVIVACLGLFGLASFMAERRRKEIGIRKTLGASVLSVVGMLSREFATLVVIANLIGWPIAYYAGSRWLESFAYRSDISPWSFIAVGVSALVIAMATVGYQAQRAARVDPATVLRED